MWRRRCGRCPATHPAAAPPPSARRCCPTSRVGAGAGGCVHCPSFSLGPSEGAPTAAAHASLNTWKTICLICARQRAWLLSRTLPGLPRLPPRHRWPAHDERHGVGGAVQLPDVRWGAAQLSPACCFGLDAFSTPSMLLAVYHALACALQPTCARPRLFPPCPRHAEPHAPDGRQHWRHHRRRHVGLKPPGGTRPLSAGGRSSARCCAPVV